MFDAVLGQVSPFPIFVFTNQSGRCSHLQGVTTYE